MSKFISGKEYNLKELFEQENNGKIIIPDLQRDYCWGDNKDLVSSFVNTIISSKDSKLILGLIYGYYEDIRPNVQLCDGQQRLTTLFLLLGLINKMCGDNTFSNLLMSDYEMKEDDMEPRLLYGIRDSSLFFLSDLVANYFLQEGEIADIPSSDIKQSSFWTESYETDSTITSMLNALDIIYEALKNLKEPLKGLGNRIIDKLYFIFYDMGNRRNGEETFVVINRTGEPLTATENLKPIIVTQGGHDMWEKNSQKWEEIDNWLWRKRNKKQNDTSDKGMKEFLRIVAGLYPEKNKDTDYDTLLVGNNENDNYVFPVSAISMEDIYNVYNDIKEIAEDDDFCKECDLFQFPIEDKLQLNEFFILLPTLRHYIKFHSIEESKRIYRFFRNLTRYTTISTENKNVIHAINAVESMTGADTICLLDVEKKINKAYILTEEEKLRLEVIKRFVCNPEEREKVESMFENLSKEDIISGEIQGVLKWCCGNKDFKAENVVITCTDKGEQDNSFEQYCERFREYFAGEATMATTLAILTFGELKNYPIVEGTKRSLPRGKSDWDKVMKGCKTENLYALGNFLKEYQNSHDTYISNHVDNIQDTDYRQILSSCKDDGANLKVGEYTINGWQRNFRVYSSGIIRVLRMNNSKAEDVFLIDGKAIKTNINDAFEPIWIWSNNVVVLDHKKYNVSFDSFKNEEGKWVMTIFERENNKREPLPSSSFDVLTQNAVFNGERMEYICDDIYKWHELIKQKIQILKHIDDGL